MNSEAGGERSIFKKETPLFQKSDRSASAFAVLNRRSFPIGSQEIGIPHAAGSYRLGAISLMLG